MYLLAIVQILLESFPVSSSGHAQLLSSICTNNVFNSSHEHIMHILHIPTAIILALFFYKDWKLFFMHPIRLRFIIVKLFFFVVLADGITTLIYFFLKKYGIHISLSFGFFVTTLLLFSLAYPVCSYKKSMTWLDAVVFGLVQGFALFPGISRFAITFAVAQWLGFSAQRSFIIVWMLQWPLIIGANMVSIFYFISSPDIFFSFFSGSMLLVVFVTSCISYYALYGVWWMIKVKKLWLFGFYEFIPLILALLINR